MSIDDRRIEMETATRVPRMPQRSSQPPAVTISPLGPAGAESEDVVAMVVEGSFDPEVRIKNYLPSRMDTERARESCAGANGIVLRLDGKPVDVPSCRQNYLGPTLGPKPGPTLVAAPTNVATGRFRSEGKAP